MEFENTRTDSSAEISESQRLAASAKKIELTPIHANITPESLNDTVSDQLVAGTFVPVANVDSDTENTSAYDTKAVVMPPKTPPAVWIAYVFSAIAVVAIVVAAIGFLVARS